MQYFHIGRWFTYLATFAQETRLTRQAEQSGQPTQKGLENGEEKGGMISETVTDYLTACFVTLPPTGSRSSISVATK